MHSSESADHTAPSGVLHVEGLRVTYGGAEACRDVTLRFGPQEVVALLGSNGAGKTTTLRAISGLARLAGGVVRLGSQTLNGMSPDRIAALGLAHVPEGRQLFTRMTVAENLEMGLYRKRPVRDPDLEPAFALFPELAPLRKRLAYSLSGGEQQMVAVARALLPEPSLVMFDEPSLGLAPVIVERIVETIELLREQGKGVLLVEQDTTIAVDCCDRGYVLANGAVVLEGSRDELISSSELLDAYIGYSSSYDDNPRPALEHN